MHIISYHTMSHNQFDCTPSSSRASGWSYIVLYSFSSMAGKCNGGGAGDIEYAEGPMCRSCHVYIDPDHLPKLPPKGFEEQVLSKWLKNRTKQ